MRRFIPATRHAPLRRRAAGEVTLWRNHCCCSAPLLRHQPRRLASLAQGRRPRLQTLGGTSYTPQGVCSSSVSSQRDSLARVSVTLPVLCGGRGAAGWPWLSHTQLPQEQPGAGEAPWLLSAYSPSGPHGYHGRSVPRLPQGRCAGCSTGPAGYTHVRRRRHTLTGKGCCAVAAV
jgi:hypothetical protein